MLLGSAPAAERERYCELILEEKSSAIAKMLKMDSPNGALKASVDAGDELIRDAQRELESLSPNQYTDSLFQFGEALRELLDQFRV
jgi:fructose-1-phosphate kinase PfkB-like protein